MRIIFSTLLIWALLSTSCQYFETKVPSEDELLQKELKKINWEKVDEFPTVAACEVIMDTTQRKQCFFEYLTQTLQDKINNDSIVITQPTFDTLDIKVTVYPDARISFEPQFKSDSLTYDKTKIDSLLQNGMSDFPKINPAIKRGIPVKTQFVLPVIIKSE